MGFLPIQDQLKAVSLSRLKTRKILPLLGSYPVSTDIMKSRVRDFSLILNFGSSSTDVFYYNKVEADFVITITGKRAYHISGSSKGSITGGNPVPGGFTFSTVTNVRTVPVEIDFDTPFYKP